MQATRVLIVDDNAGFRQRIGEFLASEPDILVVGEACDGREAIDQATELEPDVVLMDVRMAGMNGLSVTPRIKDASRGTDHHPESFRPERVPQRCLGQWRSAYVVKKSMAADLLPGSTGDRLEAQSSVTFDRLSRAPKRCMEVLCLLRKGVLAGDRCRSELARRVNDLSSSRGRPAPRRA